MSIPVAEAIGAIKAITGLEGDEVRSVGATIFVDKAITSEEHDRVNDHLSPSRIDIQGNNDQTKVYL